MYAIDRIVMEITLDGMAPNQFVLVAILNGRHFPIWRTRAIF